MLGLKKIGVITFISGLFLLTGCSDDSNGYFVPNEVTTDPSSNGNGGNNGGDGNQQLPPPQESPVVTINFKSDFFTQNAVSSNKYDIVWVVDNSGSMRDNQEAISTNFENFINRFVTKQLDFKLGITTTECGLALTKYNGAFVHDVNMFTKDSLAADQAKFINNFKNTIMVGTYGSGDEKGLQAAYSSLTNEANIGFFRADSHKIFIVVSDEEDNSIGTSDYFISLINNYTGGNAFNTMFSIVDTDGIGDYLGLKYMQAANLSGGSYFDIDGNFATVLDQLGESIAQLDRSFALTSQVTNPATIKVMVNGSQVFSGWSYNANNNSIVFAEGSEPASGSSIEVNYRY